MRIVAVETIPLKLPLPRVYKGSYYQMTHRCTVITRVHTEDGIIGEAYNGDEFERQAELCRIIREAFATNSRLLSPTWMPSTSKGAGRPCRARHTTNSATGSSPLRPSPVSTAPSGTLSAGP